MIKSVSFLVLLISILANSALRAIALFVFVSFSLSISSFAEIDFKNLRGAHEFFRLKRECDYLSPEIPLGLIRQGKLNQDFIYGDEANPKVQLIKTTFNSVSDNPAFFQVSPLAKNVAKLLPPTAVGKILGLLAKSDPTSPPRPEHIKKLIISDPDFQNNIRTTEREDRNVAELKKAQFLATHPTSIKLIAKEDELKKHKDELEKVKFEKRKELKSQYFKKPEDECTPTEKKEQYARLNQAVNQITRNLYEETLSLEKKVKDLNKKIQDDPTYQMLNNLIEKASYDEKNLDRYIGYILAAFASEETTHQENLRHSTEQILLSLGWMNGKDKGDLLSLYEPLPNSCFEDEQIFSADALAQKKRSAWLRKSYNGNDYARFIKRIMKRTPQERAEYFLRHPGRLGFLSYGRPFYDPRALPTMGFKQVTFIHPVSKEKVKMADCMEYAILNKMLNDLSGGPGNRFDVQSLEENLAKTGYEMHPGLKNFLNKYSDPSQVNEPAAHTMWAELVSGLKGVVNVPYHPTYEMEPTVGNALEVYSQLLFHKMIREVPNPYMHLTRAEKLDLVCNVLSRPGKIVDWSLRGSKSKNKLNNPNFDTGLVLEFTINSVNRYTWKMNASHSQVNPIEKDTLDWRKGVGTAMAEIILKEDRLATSDRRTLAWFLDSADGHRIVRQFKSKKNEPSYDDLLWSIPLESVRNKLFMIGKLAEKQKWIEVDKIKAELPTDDQYSQFWLASILANNRYPFWNSPTTRAGATFVSNPHHPILGNAWKDPRGVYWGDAVRDQEGHLKKMSWKDAKNYCFNLNSETENEKVLAFLNKIESNTELKDLRTKYFKELTLESRKVLLNKYIEIKGAQIQGCYLAPVEEFIMLGVDLGYTEEGLGHYRPEFLPDLVGAEDDSVDETYRDWWSSSISPFYSKDHLHFSGVEGKPFESFGSETNLTRCSCGDAAW